MFEPSPYVCFKYKHYNIIQGIYLSKIASILRTFLLKTKYICFIVRKLQLNLCPPSFAETISETGDPVADGGPAAALLLRSHPGHRPDLHGAHGQEEAPVGGRVQPQHSGGGWSSAGDGQHAQSAPGGKTHLKGRYF